MPYWETCTNEKMDVIKHGLAFSQLKPPPDDSGTMDKLRGSRNLAYGIGLTLTMSAMH